MTREPSKKHLKNSRVRYYVIVFLAAALLLAGGLAALLTRQRQKLPEALPEDARLRVAAQARDYYALNLPVPSEMLELHILSAWPAKPQVAQDASSKVWCLDVAVFNNISGMELSQGTWVAFHQGASADWASAPLVSLSSIIMNAWCGKLGG
jgi:hypothetical protein